MPSPERQIDTTIEVVTPENISFRYEVAGPFRRLPAFILDFAIRVGVMLATLLVLGFLGASGEIWTVVFLLLWFVMEWFYGALFETYWNGMTPGKWAMSIRVLRTDGQPINGMQGIMRNLLRLADLMPFAPASAFGGGDVYFIVPTGMIGILIPLLNSRYQRLGDIVCGTMVVVEEKHHILTNVHLKDPRVEQLAAELPPSFRVGPKTSRALASYLERRKYLSAARRNEIATHLAEPILSLVDIPADTDYDLLMCALYHRTFIAKQTNDSESSAEQPAALEKSPKLPA